MTELEVLVVTARRTRRHACRSSSASLVEQALDAAATVEGRWIAVVAITRAAPREQGAAFDAIQKRLPASRGHRRQSRPSWLHLAARDRARGDELYSRAYELGLAVRSIGRARNWHGDMAIVVRDPDLERALSHDDRGPRVLGRRHRDAMIALDIDPALAPRRTPPPWSGNAVRNAERVLSPEPDKLPDRRLGASALLKLAGDHHGWAILPVDTMPRAAGIESLRRLGFRFFAPLARDDLFCPAQIPVGWELVAADRDAWSLTIVDAHGEPRVGVAYEPYLCRRWAFIRLLDDTKG